MTEFNIPDAMPTLAAGPHPKGSGKACVMEYVSLLAGEAWSDMPECSLPMLARAAQVLNDSMLDADRHLLIPLIGRLFGSGGTGKYNLHQVQVMLARFAYSRVVTMSRTHPVYPEVVSHFRDTVRAAGDVPVYTRDDMEYRAKADPVYLARRDREYGEDSVAAQSVMQTYMHLAMKHLGTEGAVAELSAVLDEYDLITGRAKGPELTPEELAALALKLAATTA